MQHHRTAGLCQRIRRPQQVFLTRRLADTVASKAFLKARFSQSGNVLHIVFPALRPAEICQQRAWQAKGEVEGGAPGARPMEKGLKRFKSGQAETFQQGEPVIVQDAEGAGDGLAASGRAGEVNAEDVHGPPGYSCAMTFLLMARRVAKTPLPSEAMASKVGTWRRLR